MKLWQYECLKVIQKKTFWYCILCFLLFDVIFVLGWKQLQDPTGYIQQAKDEVKELLKDKHIQEAYQWLQHEQQIYDEIKTYQQATIFSDDTSSLSKEANTYRVQYKDHPYFWNERSQVIQELLIYYQNIMDYHTYIENVHTSYETIQNSPTWMSMSTTQKQDLMKQHTLYRQLQDTNLKIISYDGIQTYMETSIGKYIGVFYIFLCVILLFQEDNTYMEELLYSTKHGQKKTRTAKIICLGVLSMIGVSSILLVDIGIYQCIYDIFPMFAQIQSIPLCYESPYAYTILQYLCYMIIFATVCTTCLGYVYLCFFQAFKNQYVGMFLFFIVLMIQAVCFVMIPKTSYLYILSLYNIFSLFDNTLLSTYYPSLSIQQIQIPHYICLPICFICIAILCILYFQIFYKKRYKQQKCFTFPQCSFLSTSLYAQEYYRTLWIKKGWILLCIVLCSCVSMYLYQRIDTQTIRTQEVHIAQRYAPYEGVVNEQKIYDLSQKVNKIKKLEKQLQEAKIAYQQQELTRTEYITIQNAYQQLYEQYQVYIQLYEQTQNGTNYLIYPNGFIALCNLKNVDRNSMIALCIMICLILFLSTTYVSPQEEILFQSTTYGVKKRQHTILWVSISIGLLISLCIAYFEYLHVASLYPMQDWHAPMQVLFSYTHYQDIYQWGSYSIYTYIMISMIVKLFGILSTILIGLTIFRYCTGLFQGIILCLFIFILPMFLYYCNITFISWFSIFDIIMGHKFLLDTYNIIKLIILCFFDCFIYSMYKKSFQKSI